MFIALYIWNKRSEGSSNGADADWLESGEASETPAVYSAAAAVRGDGVELFQRRMHTKF
jgi:hypothetical protein